MNYRLIAIILLIVSIIFLPYWVYVPTLIIAMAVLPIFWEGILFGFLIDALYGQRISSLSTLVSSAAFLALIGLLILIPLRKRIRSHV